MPAKKKEAAIDMDAHYRVLIAGISIPGGAPLFQGAIAVGREIGDEARVAKLLALGRIEIVSDDD